MDQIRPPGPKIGHYPAQQIASGAAWIGSPDEIAATIARLRDEFGVFEHASLQVNFNLLPYAPALASLRLFAREVMPRFAAREPLSALQGGEGGAQRGALGG